MNPFVIKSAGKAQENIENMINLIYYMNKLDSPLINEVNTVDNKTKIYKVKLQYMSLLHTYKEFSLLYSKERCLQGH